MKHLTWNDRSSEYTHVPHLYRWISLSCTQAVSQHVPSCSSSLSVNLGPQVWAWPSLSALGPGLQHLTGSWHPWPKSGPLSASVSCTLPSERWRRSAGPDASYWWAQPSPYSTTSECLRSERNIYSLIKISFYCHISLHWFEPSILSFTKTHRHYMKSGCRNRFKQGQYYLCSTGNMQSW